MSDPIDDTVLWLDLETTGLQPEKTVILEVGAKIVSYSFEIIDTFHRVVQHDPIPDMDDWCRNTHSKSGLLKDIAQDGVPLKFVELAMCSWLDKWFPDNKITTYQDGSKEGQIILVGTGIHFDRRYIRYHMPLVNERLHHRMIDVSAVYYFNKVFKQNINLPHKTSKENLEHRALSDIDDSINLAKALC